MKTALTDRYGRRINYLRLSVTDRCNLSCSYCIPPEGRTWLPHNEILRYEEIIRITEILAEHGIQKVRLTGGEPLMRKNLVCLIREIRKINGIREVALTTNGVLLADHAAELKLAGIDRINVSLDTLKHEVFKSITGKDSLNSVLDGIEKAMTVGIQSIKLNAVPMEGVNDQEIEDLAFLSFEKGIHVRFIEQMPVGFDSSSSHGRIGMSNIKNQIESRWGRLIPVISSPTDGPARRFRIPGARGEIGFISAMTRHFCASCNRIRITALGHIRPCLLNDYSVDIKTHIRNGYDDSALARLVRDAVERKDFVHDSMPAVSTRMVSIGG